MIKVLILDDSEEKVIQISKIIKSLNVKAEINIASDIFSARGLLNSTNVDILVLDQYLPNIINEEVLPNGGVGFLREIQQNKFNNMPRAIFGLSICDSVKHDYYWPFYHYNHENLWFRPFKSLVNYVHLFNEKYKHIEINNDDVNFVFVEGVTDYIVLKKCLDLFYPHLEARVLIKFERGSGAAWVVRQLFANVFLLPKKNNGDLIKCVGVFDNDETGRSSIEKINGVINLNAAERHHFKLFKYQGKYSPIIKSAGMLDANCELEDFLPPSLWLFANESGYLQDRDERLFNLDSVNKKDLYSACKMLEPEISELESSQYIQLYNSKYVSDDKKQKIVNELVRRDSIYLENGLKFYKFILDDILRYFGLFDNKN